jgi:hypothetical protein
MMTRILILGLFLCAINISVAQKTNDPNEDDFDALAQQSEYLSQLVNNWYVKKKPKR